MCIVRVLSQEWLPLSEARLSHVSSGHVITGYTKASVTIPDSDKKI